MRDPRAVPLPGAPGTVSVAARKQGHLQGIACPKAPLGGAVADADRAQPVNTSNASMRRGPVS